ncbi:MAG: hypothetical protein ISS41_08650 [Candidatus Aminicenantes bacterium]|nr:hypothetical protein [Candidatus Aminicenantes bacterium]MBL7083683.1 hypothetical protein [Candidatus Aminicenantes bacterium]
MKRVSLIIIVSLAVSVLAVIQTGCKKPPTIEELQASVEIIDIETKWVKKIYKPWPPKLTLAPAISFRAKNISNEPLKYVFFNAIFWQKGDKENLGDNLQIGIGKKPLMPGEVSDTLLMKSNFGVEGKLLADFKNNPAWKTTLVKLFIKSKGSQYALLGQWEVSRKIDFKEPERVGPKK